MSGPLPTVLVDENIPYQLAGFLGREGVRVIHTVSTHAGESDDVLLDWASREGWVLVTGDLDFPRLIFAEHRVPPLLLIVERRQPCDPDRLAHDILRALRIGEPLHGHVIVFSRDDERVRAFPRRA